VGIGTPSYRGFRFPVEIINHCVWLYYRFPLSPGSRSRRPVCWRGVTSISHQRFTRHHVSRIGTAARSSCLLNNWQDLEHVFQSGYFQWTGHDASAGAAELQPGILPSSGVPDPDQHP